MKNKIFFIGILLNLFFIFPLFAGDTAFVRTYGGRFKEVAYDVKQTYDSGFVIIGSTNSYGEGLTSVYLVKTDSSGIFQWSKTFGGINIDLAYSIQVNADSGFSILGYTNSIGSGGYDMRLIKTDALGNKLWEKTYGGTDWDFGYSHAILPDSGYVLCGETYSYTNGSSDVYVIRTDKFGDTLWTKHFGGAWADAAYTVIVENVNSFVIVGSQGTSSSDADGLFLKLDSNGNTLALKTYGGTKNDVFKSVSKTNDNGFVLHGTSNSFSTGGDNDAYLVKTDNSGNYIYHRLLGSTGPDEGTAIVEIKNGNLNTTGTLTNFGLGGTAMSVYRTDFNGSWIDGAAFGGVYEETGNAITLTKTGGIVYVGLTSSWGQGQEDMYFVKMYKESIVANYILHIVNYNDSLLSDITHYTINSSSEITITPNPFSAKALVTIENHLFQINQKASFEMFDVYGKLIFQKNINSPSFEIVRGDLSPGIYFYSIINGDKVFKGKIIIQ